MRIGCGGGERSSRSVIFFSGRYELAVVSLVGYGAVAEIYLCVPMQGFSLFVVGQGKRTRESMQFRRIMWYSDVCLLRRLSCRINAGIWSI